MLYYGTSYMIPVLNTNTVIYNISSYNENLNRLNLLPPMDKRLFIDNGKDFDMFYAQWILGNDMIFFDFFKIIYDLYLGKDVYLTVDSADWSENVIESLLKLIQQRYGYNGTLIDSFEGYIYASNNITSGFDPNLIMNLDMDKDRFSILLVRMNPNNLKIGVEN